MGVPKFYRWISERYPKINQVITDSALLPEFDHLYLDMNGIIHGCTHPSHMDVSDVLSERDMMFGIMHYLDRIITQIVKPKVSVYMAIDGVAPRAKLNQQRSRRFRSAKDMAEATKDTAFSKLEQDVGADGPSQGVFDSNCITPGTEFMARVSNVIKYFIRKKIKEDPLWKGLKIIFSGHEVPGEGEHKIMQHIREMRSQPGYQPNSRHCMYGQDADLIMLGLVSHEPHFTLLREVIDFGGFNNDKNSLKIVKKFTKESDFQLLHLSVLREYLHVEFAYGLEDGSYNLERIIDDFVFMTFLVGNDFLPHMPSLDIGDGAFDLLFGTFKEQWPTWGEGQYMTHEGDICDPERLENFIAVIGAAETEIFEKREENEADYTKKRRKWDKRDGKTAGPSDKEIALEEASKQNDYHSMIQIMMEKNSIDDKFVDGWEPVTTPGQKDFKGRYYFEKLKFTPVDIDDHLALRKSYIEGLMWCLAYYYRGCISWGWFYPYHYGPMLSDLTGMKKLFQEIKFDIGAPLKPFEQLMGCLPPASSMHVPRPYRKLMTTSESPIIHFYPTDFDVDMNGKKNPWEGVNLLPWIDATVLKSAIATHVPDSVLTADERQRNALGSVLCYTHDPTANDTVPSANREIGLTDIKKCQSRVNVIDAPERLDIPFKAELVQGTQIPYPGFPSLNVLPIKNVELAMVGLNCFGFPSKYMNMILTLHEMPQLPPAEQLAGNIIGKSLYINWPMMHEARVVAVSDSNGEIRLSKKKKKVRKWTAVEAQRWESDSEDVAQQYLNGGGIPGSGGVNIGEVQIRLKLVPLQGMKINPTNGSTKKVFGIEEADVPLQLALWKAPAPDPRFIEQGPLTLEDRFPANSSVVLTKGKYRGCKGSVIGVVDGGKVGVKVEVIPPEPPFGLAIARSVQESYISAGDAAKILQIIPTVFSKITGSLNVDPGRYDLGLNLKYRNNLCVLGYTRQRKETANGKGKGKQGDNIKKAWGAGDSLLVVGSARSNKTDDRFDNGKGQGERIQWEYTPKAVRLVAAYRQKFPQVFAAVCKFPNERFYDAKKLFGPNGVEMLPKIREWLNNVETAKIPRTPTSTDAMPFAAIHAVQRAADVRSAAQDNAGPLKDSLIKVPSSALYREGSTTATDVVLASDHNEDLGPELGDRVANLCANGIPFGARGTVVSVHDPTSGCVEVVMDEEFIGGSTLQGACSNFRGKLCVWAYLLKTSASDSKGLVDQIIPVGSGKATVDKLLVNHKNYPERQDSQPRHDKGRSEQADVFVEPSGSNIRKKTVTPSKAAARPVSSGRSGRLATWKEAKGPPEKGHTFTRAGRSGKTGIAIWKHFIASGGLNKTGSPTPEIDRSKTAGLKAVLGVKKNVAAPSNMEPQNGDQTANITAGLKAMLGVGVSPQPTAVRATPPAPPQAAAPVTAADRLLHMMMNKQPTAQQVIPPQQASAFNFAYVEEGKTSPTVGPPLQSQMPHPVVLMPPVGMPHPNFGMPPGAYPPVVAPMHVAHVPQSGVNPMVAKSSQFPSPVDNSQFPPLGAQPVVNVQVEKKRSNDEKTAPIVPSNVSTQSRK